MTDHLELNLTVRGSDDINLSNMGVDLSEGWSTGGMSQFGLSINTVWMFDKQVRTGGVLDRGQVKEMRDYLNKVIDKWSNEKPTNKTPHEIMMDNVNREHPQHD